VDLQYHPQAWIQPQLLHLNLPDDVVEGGWAVVPVKGGGIDRDVVDAVDDVDAVGGRYVHGVHVARYVRGVVVAVAVARGVVGGLESGGSDEFDGVGVFGGGGVVWFEGLEGLEGAVASAAFGLVSDLAFGLVSDLESALAFDLASGQAGFGAALADCHTLNPLYF